MRTTSHVSRTGIEAGRLLGCQRYALQPVLRGHEALHDLEIAIAQLQTRVRPNLNDAIKFLERDRIDLASDPIDRTAARVTPFAALDKIARCGNPLPRLRQDVDQTSVFHLLGRVDAP